MSQEPTTGIALTAGQAARQLGVAVTTLRSWHRRYGLGPTQHQRGRHRRYGADDLARLETMRTLTARGVAPAQAARMALTGVLAPPPADHSAGADAAYTDWAGPAVRGLTSAAMRLDAAGARTRMDEALVTHGVVATWDGLIRPVLERVGSRHAATDALVEVEHLLSRSVSEALAAVRRPPPEAPVRVLLACADEEQHSLPLEALAAALAEREVAVRLLGARVPPEALYAAVRRTGPALVVVWSHAPATADPAQLAPLLAGPARRPLVAVAGPGWGGHPPAGVVQPETLSDATELADATARAARHTA
jgi:MerR family transcriptional regulator, light-induced transcriptional regulator